MITMPTVGLIVIKHHKLLLAFSRNKQAWYLPGGKVDSGETPIQALKREIKEELNLDLKTAKLKPYCHISAAAYGEDTNIMMEQDCFLYDTDQEIIPGNEIEAIKYFDHDTYLAEYITVAGVLQVFELLTKDHLLAKV